MMQNGTLNIHRYHTLKNQYVYDTSTAEIVKVDNLAFEILGLVGKHSEAEIIDRRKPNFAIQSVQDLH